MRRPFPGAPCLCWLAAAVLVAGAGASRAGEVLRLSDEEGEWAGVGVGSGNASNVSNETVTTVTPDSTVMTAAMAARFMETTKLDLSMQGTVNVGLEYKQIGP